MLVREALRTLGLAWRPLYGLALRVTALTTLVGGGIVAGGFLVGWDSFEAARSDAEAAIAAEDSYVAYADQMDTLEDIGLGVTVLLLALAAAVVCVMQTAHTVALDHSLDGEGRLTVKELWARARPHVGVAYWVQWRSWVRVGAIAFLGFALWVAVEAGEVPGVERTGIGETATMQYRIVGWGLPIAIAGLGLLVYFRYCVATAALVSENTSSRAAVKRAWALTKGAPWKTYGIGLLLTAFVVLGFVVLRYAATPLAHPIGLAMLWLSGDNVWVTGVLVLITPTAIALLLMPLVVLPPVCTVVAQLYRDLRVLESDGRVTSAV
ncbi:hypothetical protein [Streptomyces yerevanensis]|uniref:hypothetical protein n=1 Tax=Streptomyces yerevanensis TaxID=66378 RepID=UPI0005276379|nr:hypothetical protein [Streptomyces yerevanensis]